MSTKPQIEVVYPVEPYFDNRLWGESFRKNYERISQDAKMRVIILQTKIRGLENRGAAIFNMDEINKCKEVIWKIFNLEEPPEPKRPSHESYEDGSGI